MSIQEEIEKTPWLLRLFGYPTHRKRITYTGVGGIFNEFVYPDSELEPVEVAVLYELEHIRTSYKTYATMVYLNTELGDIYSSTKIKSALIRLASLNLVKESSEPNDPYRTIYWITPDGISAVRKDYWRDNQKVWK